MYRKFLLVIICLGLCLSIIQLSLFAFSDTLDDGMLTVVGIGSGLFIALCVGLFQKRSNYFLLAFFFSFLSIAVISYTNTKFSNAVSYETFTVISKDYKIVKYSKFEYLELSNGSITTEYAFHEDSPDSNYKIGDVVNVKLKKSFWGYPIIESIHKPIKLFKFD